MKIKHIAEIFDLEREEFVAEAYRNLLGREPDINGMAYYLGRLSMGYGKSSVISEMATSSEYIVTNNIRGVSNIISEIKLSKNWFFGFFSKKTQLEKEQFILINSIIKFNKNYNKHEKNMDKKIEIIHDVLTKMNNNIKELHLAGMRSPSVLKGSMDDRAKDSIKKNLNSFDRLPLKSREIILKSLVRI